MIRRMVAAGQKPHYLYFVDLEYQTAFCSVCGPTDIYVVKRRNNAPPKAICLNRLKASQQAQKRPINGQGRTGPKPLHPLSEIDEENLRAVCAVCGPTDILKRAGNKYTTYSCANRERGYGRKYRRSHYISQTSNPLVHALSEIDEEKKTAMCSRCGFVRIDIWWSKKKIRRRCKNVAKEAVQRYQHRYEPKVRLIDEYKSQHGCQRCGEKSSPLVDLELHRTSDESVVQIPKLVELHRKRLMLELEKSEVLCTSCHRLLHEEPEFDRHGSAIPLQFAHL